MTNGMVRLAACGAALALACAAAPAGDYVWKDGKWELAAPPAEGTPQGELNLIRQWVDQKQYKQAVQAAERFLKRYSDDPAREEAKLLAGQAQLEAGMYWQAYEWFEQELDEFPGGPFLERALMREMEVADAFLAGKKRILWGGLIRLPAEDEGLKILNRVADHAPGTEIAEKALLRIGQYKYTNGKWSEAAEAYDHYLALFPKSERSPHAMLQAARAMYAAFRGAPFDETPIIDAEQRLKAFKERYPGAAEKENVGDMLSTIVVARAEKTFRTAEFYDRIGRHKAAQFYYRLVVENYGELSWGEQARTRIMGLELADVPPEATSQPAGAPATQPVGPPAPAGAGRLGEGVGATPTPTTTTSPAPIPLEDLVPTQRGAKP
jgi:outer membrane protein assembly factor BamD (BamD/ComL family)